MTGVWDGWVMMWLKRLFQTRDIQNQRKQTVICTNSAESLAKMLHIVNTIERSNWRHHTLKHTDDNMLDHKVLYLRARLSRLYSRWKCKLCETSMTMMRRIRALVFTYDAYIIFRCTLLYFVSRLLCTSMFWVMRLDRKITYIIVFCEHCGLFYLTDFLIR